MKEVDKNATIVLDVQPGNNQSAIKSHLLHA